MNRLVVRIVAVAFTAMLFSAPWYAKAESLSGPPRIPVAQLGAIVEDVSVETYGVVKPEALRRYLSLRPGARLEQSAVDRDYANLVRLGDFRTRLVVRPGTGPGTVKLHWIVMSKWLKPTAHPFYADQPLSAPIQGVGFILTAPPQDRRGTNFSAYTQFSSRANLLRVLFTVPLNVNAETGRESDVIVDGFGGRGDFRESQPRAINVYSWALGEEALFLTRGTSGTQFEGGLRFLRTTNAESSGIVSPSLYPTNVAPSRSLQIALGLSHACVVPPAQWHPPYCKLQYRFEAFDGIGGFGSTSRYRTYIADVARYIAVGSSTLALRASAARTGGVLPDSALVCATVRGYPKSFCGTDAEGITAEFRIDDALQRPLEFVLFDETAASRVRDGTQSFAPAFFEWHPDCGIGVIYHLLRIDLAYGQGGGRLTFELKGQTF